MKKMQNITLYRAVTDTEHLLPFVDDGIKAGFPSPAQDYVEQGIDLNKALIKHPESTFLAKVDGNSMTDSWIFDGDIVVIDKSLEVRNGCKVIAFIDGEFTMKNIKIENEVLSLVPDNPDYPTITITPDRQFLIWGVVTHVIHKLY
ncbi:MAG: translesion error-prone DNA polymerase V autoproteolytic subunit [Marinilabiliaceae bacterium]|nr:translesion error-prone DNA polymerase V autoproteolytic subunit [Marinilabiliaceae bacterium]